MSNIQINTRLQAIRKTTVAFASLFKDIIFIQYDENGSETERKRVPIVYGNKEKYIKRQEASPGTIDEKVQITLPRIEYGLINMQYDPSRRTNQFNKFQGCQSTNDVYVNSPVPYVFNFELVIYTRNVEDANQILEYITPFFYPEYNVRINFVPDAGIIKNVPIKFDGESEDEDATGSFDSPVRSVYRTLNFSARSYIFPTPKYFKKIFMTQTNLITNIYRNQYKRTPSAIPFFVLDFLGTASNYTIGKKFKAGFESASDFDGFYITPYNNGTSHHEFTDINKISGINSNHGYITGANPILPGQNTNHRAYPTIQMYKKPSLDTFYGKVLIEFWVNVNFPLYPIENKNWVSLASFTSYADDYWSKELLINLDSNYIINLTNAPDTNQSIHDIYQTDSIVLNTNQWAKITVLIDYTIDNTYNSQYAAVWQNGQLVSASRINNRLTVDSARALNRPCSTNLPSTATVQDYENACGLNYVNGLAQAHFGLYAAPLLSSGEIFNDDLSITEILKI